MYKLETFIDTRIVSLPTFVFFYEIEKSSGILYIGLLQLRHGLRQCLHKRLFFFGGAVAS